jgi:mannose-6-phosphate isomerase-like protein (cupin superfamily)
MTGKTKYNINLETKFGFLKHINIPALVEDCSEDWTNQTLCEVNDCVVRLGILKGEFHWHKHDNEDEFFLVLDGTLFIDLENEVVTLTKHEGFNIPKGVLHKTRAPDKVVVVMIEGAGVKPTGD